MFKALIFLGSSEIIAKVTTNCYPYLKSQPENINMPDFPEPTSFNLTKNFYFNSRTIVKKILKILNIKDDISNKIEIQSPHDVPGEWFKGPF